MVFVLRGTNGRDRRRVGGGTRTPARGVVTWTVDGWKRERAGRGVSPRFPTTIFFPRNIDFSRPGRIQQTRSSLPDLQFSTHPPPDGFGDGGVGVRAPASNRVRGRTVSGVTTGVAMSDPESKAQRVRTLLAGYYGHAQSSASPSSLQQRVPSVPPIDAPDFDPETWVCDTLRDTSLGQLSVKCQQMKREAVALNGESQMLVYENYSKFIAATDTVRDVAKNVVEMEGKMAQLKQQMLLTTAKAQAVDKNLGIRREQVEQLSGVRSLISKLQGKYCAFPTMCPLFADCPE